MGSPDIPWGSLSIIYMTTIAKYYVLPALAACLMLTSCGGSHKDESDSSDVIVTVGDSALTRLDVERLLPGGLAEPDSSRMADAIVSAWVSRLLLEDFGRENIDDIDRIERLTAEYRLRLIAEAYRRKLREEGASDVDAHRIHQYYQEHRDSLILDAPIVKGIFLKVHADAPNISMLRQLVFDGSPDAVDNLEKSGLAEAMQYSFFGDQWVDWQDIAGRIPYRFTDPDAFVASNVNFETSRGGSVYMLHIFDFRRSGNLMPEEYAAPLIAGIISRQSAADYERNLLVSIARKALKEGRMTLTPPQKLRF